MILGYIDPGQGMLIWQAIVSAFVGILFYLKKTRRFIVGIFRKIFGAKIDAAEADISAAKVAPEVKVETKIEA